MAQLIKCIECQSLISSLAQECPKCASKDPFGQSCLVCQKPVKVSEAISVHYSSYTLVKGDPFNGNFYFHKDCHSIVAQIGVEDHKCPLCNHLKKGKKFDLSNKQNRQAFSSYLREACSNCGHPYMEHNRIGHSGCAYCHFPVKLTESVSVSEFAGVSKFNLYAHKVCFTEKRKQEIVNPQSRPFGTAYKSVFQFMSDLSAEHQAVSLL